MALLLTYNFEKTSMIQLMKLDTTSFNEVILLLPRILEIKANIITTQSTHSHEKILTIYVIKQK